MEKIPTSSAEGLKRAVVTGESESAEKWSKEDASSIRDMLDMAKKYKSEAYSHGFTERSYRVLKGMYRRVAEVADQVHITCEIEVPDWHSEEPHESVGGMSLMGHDAMVKVKYTIREGEQVTEKEFETLLIPDDEDPIIHYDRPLPFEGHQEDTDDARAVYPNGWGEDDVKNELAREAFENAIRQIPHPDDVPASR